MTTEHATLKKWIEDANKLRELTDVFPEEVQGMVYRLAAVVEKLAYENIALDEERKDLKIKYGNLLKTLYESGRMLEVSKGAYKPI